MVKGISRRVVIIKSPDTELFDEAIFLVRDDAAREGVTREDLLREAAMVATGLPSGRARAKNALRLLLAGTVGASLTGLMWLITLFL